MGLKQRYAQIKLLYGGYVGVSGRPKGCRNQEEVMKRDLKYATQQRAEATRNLMASATLELMLRDQIRRAFAGEQQAMIEFQQDIQYAPPEMKERMLGLICTTP